MKVINIALPEDLKSIEIHIGADWHIGDKQCDEKLIKERIDYIKDTPNAYLILNGDLLNNARKS